MTTVHPALEYEHVTIRYGAGMKPVLADVTLRINSGERVALLGNNGTGKTSLLLATAGLIAFEGTIRVHGMELTDRSIAGIRRQTGVLFSTPDDQLLFPRVLDDVAFSASRFSTTRTEAEATASAVLAGLRVNHLRDRSPHQLSHGERLAVALAGAIAGTPGLLLLDEPSTTLDPPAKRTVARILRSHPASALIATHDLPFARRVCQRFVVLAEGRITLDTHNPDAIHEFVERDDDPEPPPAPDSE
jgi:cobalt/nickel transport system ATP-binding protein